MAADGGIKYYKMLKTVGKIWRECDMVINHQNFTECMKETVFIKVESGRSALQL